MTPEEARERLVATMPTIKRNGVWEYDPRAVVAYLLAEREALLVALGGNRMYRCATHGGSLTNWPTGPLAKCDMRPVWTVPDE